jgi:hypothetical protein
LETKKQILQAKDYTTICTVNSIAAHARCLCYLNCTDYFLSGDKKGKWEKAYRLKTEFFEKATWLHQKYPNQKDEPNWISPAWLAFGGVF